MVEWIDGFPQNLAWIRVAVSEKPGLKDDGHNGRFMCQWYDKQVLCCCSCVKNYTI